MIIDRNENKEVIALLGAGGMGVAIIKKFAAGKKILLGDISQAKLDEVAKDFTYLGYDVECMIVDGCSKEAVEAFASTSCNTWTSYVFCRFCRSFTFSRETGTYY